MKTISGEHVKRKREQIRKDLLEEYGFQIKERYFKVTEKTTVIDVISGVEISIYMQNLYYNRSKKWEERKRIYREWRERKEQEEEGSSEMTQLQQRQIIMV